MIRFEGIKACVFDAYGTLFDFNAAAMGCRDALGDKAGPVAEVWRTKQLQYTWLRGLMGKHADFWRVTGDALDFALAAAEISDDGLRKRLLDLYWQLDAYPEVPEMLEKLKSAGMKCAILSNGTPGMLEAAAQNAGIAGFLDDLISVEDVGVFKPHPSVYSRAADRLGLAPYDMSFQSANAWDAAAAAAFGYRVVWINRAGQPPERLPWQPDVELTTLEQLPAIVTA